MSSMWLYCNVSVYIYWDLHVMFVESKMPPSYRKLSIKQDGCEVWIGYIDNASISRVLTLISLFPPAGHIRGRLRRNSSIRRGAGEP